MNNIYKITFKNTILNDVGCNIILSDDLVKEFTYREETLLTDCGIFFISNTVVLYDIYHKYLLFNYSYNKINPLVKEYFRNKIINKLLHDG